MFKKQETYTFGKYKFPVTYEITGENEIYINFAMKLPENYPDTKLVQALIKKFSTREKVALVSRFLTYNKGADYIKLETIRNQLFLLKDIASAEETKILKGMGYSLWCNALQFAVSKLNLSLDMTLELQPETG